MIVDLDTTLTDNNLFDLPDQQIAEYVTTHAFEIAPIRVIEKMTYRTAVKVSTYREWIECSIREVTYEDACGAVDL